MAWGLLPHTDDGDFNPHEITRAGAGVLSRVGAAAGWPALGKAKVRHQSRNGRAVHAGGVAPRLGGLARKQSNPRR